MSDDENTEFTPEEPEHINENEDIQSAEEFRERFGFDHDCHCAEDWATGNLGVTAICYLNMCKTALEMLEEAVVQLKERDEEIAELRIALAED